MKEFLKFLAGVWQELMAAEAAIKEEESRLFRENPQAWSGMKFMQDQLRPFRQD